MSVFPLLVLTAAAADPDYFPLQVGNQWIYRVSGAAPGVATVEVVKAGYFHEDAYYLLRGPGAGETWVRLDSGGALRAYDAKEGTDKLWLDFAAPEDTPFDTSIHPCSKSASVASRNARYSGPLGDFDWALLIRYQPGACADAGLEREFYLPWVGLIHRTETTIAGPRGYDLIYARVGGVTVVSEKEVTFSLTLDKPVYTANLMPPVVPQYAIPVMTARLNFRVVQSEPLRLTFASGQTYELVLKNEKGEVVYRWSDGKAFTDAIRQESFGPGERNYTVLVRLSGKDGKPFPPGKYAAEGWLTTMGDRLYFAGVGFEIRHVF
ncbi:MAG: BsuPI-related putative proteinase inhibitor [Bryobacteraceae bacterium]